MHTTDTLCIRQEKNRPIDVEKQLRRYMGSDEDDVRFYGLGTTRGYDVRRRRFVVV